MKEQKQEYNQVQEVQPVQSQQKQQMKKIQHPQEQYSVSEVYSIRKQSSNIANDHIYKKLSKSFHKIKKLRAEPNSTNIFAREFDYENNPIRLSLKKAHDLYNNCTRTNLIVKKKIDKMRGKVDKIKAQIQNSELTFISQIDINKIYTKNTNQTATQPQNQQKEKAK